MKLLKTSEPVCQYLEKRSRQMVKTVNPQKNRGKMVLSKIQRKGGEVSKKEEIIEEIIAEDLVVKV